MTSIAIMFNVVWRYAGANHRLLVPGIADEALAKMNRNYLAGPVVYGSATLIAFVQPYVSLAIFAGLAVYWLLPGTGPRAEGSDREELTLHATPSSLERGGRCRRPAFDGPAASCIESDRTNIGEPPRSQRREEIGMKHRHLLGLGLAVGLVATVWAIPGQAQPRSHRSPLTSVTWTFGAPIPFGGGGATRFDGELYAPANRVYFLGFRAADNSTDGSIWYYDTVARTYTDTGIDMPVPVSNYQISALTDASGRLGFYIFGGRDNLGNIVTTVQVFFPATMTTGVVTSDPWPGTTPSACVSLPAMGVATAANHAIVIGGVAFIANGCVADENSAQTWIYFPKNAPGTRWKQGPNLNLARGYVTPAVLSGRVYAIGGDLNVGGSLFAQSIVEAWKPPTGGWNDAGVADLPQGCDESQAFSFTGGPLANDVVLAGCGQWGQPSQALPDTYVYSSSTNTWSDDGAFNTARRNHAGVLLGTKMFCLGGYASDGITALSSTELGTGSPFAGRPGLSRPAPATAGEATTS